MLSSSQEMSTKELAKGKIFFCEEVSGNVSNDTYVGVAQSKVGKVLMSDSFGPCQAVVAILKNGEYGLYHAHSMAKTKALMSFVELIKDKVEIVFVFQKSKPMANLQKAPYLAINLARELDYKVERIHFDGYTGIYVNADNKEIVLCKENTYEYNSKETEITFTEKQEIAFQPIGIKTTVSELYEKHKNDYKPCSQGVIVGNDVVITEKFGSGLFRKY